MAIELTKQETEEAGASIRRFFREELEIELSEIQSGFVLKYFLKELAPHGYNRGVSDAERYFRSRVEELAAVCYEQPMTYWQKPAKGACRK